MAFVYWFHLETHNDIESQGYVGITSGTHRRRWREHKSSLLRGSHPNNYLQNVVNKYGFEHLKFTVICECSEDYAKWLEEKLRPYPKIGWNLLKGGEANFEHVPMTEERKKLQSVMAKNLWKNEEYRTSQVQKHMGVKKSEESKQKLSASLKEFYKDGSPLPVFRRGKANLPQCKELWLQAAEIFNYYISGMGDRSISKEFGFDKRNSTIMKICRLFQTGWIPSEDSEWVIFKEENLNGN